MYRKLSCSPCLFGCDEALLEVKSFSLSTQCKRNRKQCKTMSPRALPPWLEINSQPLGLRGCWRRKVRQNRFSIENRYLHIEYKTTQLFPFVGRLIHWSAQNCYWMLIKIKKIVMEPDLRPNDRFLSLMNITSRNCSSFHANEFVFSHNEQQKV